MTFEKIRKKTTGDSFQEVHKEVMQLHARIQKDLSGGPTLTLFFFFFFFFIDGGEGGSKYHYKRAIIGPPAKTIYMM